jgi:serralysin
MIDGLAYIASYPDLIKAFGLNANAGLNHYQNQGIKEGRTVSFNALKYIASYGDLIKAFGTNTKAATEHFILSGYSEGRIASFDAAAYLASYSDLSLAFGTDLQAATLHFITSGYNEGRKVSSENILDVQWYLAKYVDIRNAFGNDQIAATNHYLTTGRNDGHVYTPYGNDRLNGSVLSEKLNGYAGNDTITGGAGNDQLIGGLGNDQLDGGLGIDTMNGGDGDDTYWVDLIQIGTLGTNTSAASLEDIIMETNVASGGIDTVNLRTAIILPNSSSILLGSGIENLDAYYADQTKLTINGNELDNIIRASTVDNVIYGNAGNDQIYSKQGNDYLDGGIGDDIVAGGSGNDTINGGIGADSLYGDDGNDTYIIDNILDIADEEHNIDANDTVIYGVNASSSLVSTLTVGTNNFNTVLLDAATTGSISLVDIESLSITGTGRYNLIGDLYNNTLIGNAANNIINGGAGNDVLMGGVGSDTLTGGIGADSFDFNAINESNTISFDTIADFNRIQLDKIDLSTIDTKPNTLADDAFRFIGNDVAFTNVAGQLRFDSVSHRVYGDVNGDSIADFQILLTGINSMLATDFIL